MKIMLDTNIYDALYLNPKTKELLIKHVRLGSVILYGIAIQKDNGTVTLSK